MYEAHFHLRPRPFAETVDAAQYIGLPSRDSAIRRMRYGLEGSSGPVMMVGPVGSGKTILSRVLADEIGGHAVHLTFPTMPADQILAFLAEELGAPPDSTPGMAGSLRRLRSVLAEPRETRPLLIVDEAHLIDDPSVFESLRLLLNFASTGTPDLAMILVGAPDLRDKIPASLLDRLSARCSLSPLSESESAAYVLGRLFLAGAETPLFDAESLSALHREAEGLPRRLNRLADLSLLIAYARDREAADAEAVDLAAREAAYLPAA